MMDNSYLGLAGKRAVITGGGRGIGEAISLALARQGVAVLVLYQKDEQSAESVVRRILDAGGQAWSAKADVRMRGEVLQAFSWFFQKVGSFDILVNNAGINVPTDFDNISDEDWDNIMAVNLKGPFICSQLALPFMRKNGGGSIINIGSVSGQYGGPRTAHYAASKAGLISLGQVVARYGAKDNIRCNTVAAGMIASEMAQGGLQAESVRKASEGIMLGRLGMPEDVAETVVFLASETSRYITSQTINVNGGLYF